MKVFGFEKLQVWQKSRKLSKIIYKETTPFPAEEKFGLVSQMRGSAISISSNIAEGTGRHSSKDRTRFTVIAYGSALELLNQTVLSHNLEFFWEEKYNEIIASITEITAMLDGLYKFQMSNEKN